MDSNAKRNKDVVCIHFFHCLQSLRSLRHEARGCTQRIKTRPSFLNHAQLSGALPPTVVMCYGFLYCGAICNTKNVGLGASLPARTKDGPARFPGDNAEIEKREKDKGWKGRRGRFSPMSRSRPIQPFWSIKPDTKECALTIIGQFIVR